MTVDYKGASLSHSTTPSQQTAPKPLNDRDQMKPFAAGRVWSSGSVCTACGERCWATRWLKGKVYSHLGAKGEFFRCAGIQDPVFACEWCGKQKRSWIGRPKGWAADNKCTACAKPPKKPRKRKEAADAA